MLGAQPANEHERLTVPGLWLEGGARRRLPGRRATLTGTGWLILTIRAAIDALSKIISPVDVPHIADP